MTNFKVFTLWAAVAAQAWTAEARSNYVLNTVRVFIGDIFANSSAHWH